MTIGERIKERRIELGLSQDELAKKCGYKSRSSINKIELARDLPLKKLWIMAEALDISVKDLIGLDEVPVNADGTLDYDYWLQMYTKQPKPLAEPEQDRDTKQLLEDFAKLTHDQQLTVLALIHSMNSKEK